MDTVVSELTITHLDDDWDLPCEVSNHPERGSGPAAWVMWFSCCPKSDGRLYMLACTGCKDYKIGYPVITCHSCGHVFHPGSRAYRLIEALNKS